MRSTRLPWWTKRDRSSYVFLRHLFNMSRSCATKSPTFRLDSQSPFEYRTRHLRPSRSETATHSKADPKTSPECACLRSSQTFRTIAGFLSLMSLPNRGLSLAIREAECARELFPAPALFPRIPPGKGGHIAEIGFRSLQPAVCMQTKGLFPEAALRRSARRLLPHRLDIIIRQRCEGLPTTH